MKVLQIVLPLFVVCLLLAPHGEARTWQALQGEVIRLQVKLPPGTVKVRAFKRDWPWRRDTMEIVTWIGVDMKARPGSHALQWSVRRPDGTRWVSADTILVRKAAFRISHIRVDKKMAEFDAKTLARIRRDQADLRRAYAEKVQARPDIIITRMPVQGIISSPFGAQRYVNGQPRSPHSGIDIAAPSGTPVVNPLAGRVHLSKHMYLNGKTVVIGHGHGLISVYSHMKKVTVRRGQWLGAGEMLGEVGKTGRATGPHLHWGIRFVGARVNPLSLLPKKHPK